MEILIESMTSIDSEILTDYGYKKLKVRCWREEQVYNDETEENTRTEVRELLRDFFPKKEKGVSRRWQVASLILNLEDMNAVEVLNDNGNGVVLYKNWP